MDRRPVDHAARPPVPLLPMVSYAQNAEDVVLRRALADIGNGWYVDVGACHPVEDSVTKHFYDAGWSGLNVEPDPAFHALLAEARLRDVNVHAAAGTGTEPLRFYPTGTRGQGTLDPQLAVERTPAPPLEVPQVRLGDLLEEHAPPDGIAFLKVDVEGWESEVLASVDLTAIRPRVVLVEAVDARGVPTHEAWEGDLLAAGYRFCLFDGLNRFYCREEDAYQLLPLLVAPANVLDDFRLAREVRPQEQLAAALSEAQDALGGLRAELEGAVAQAARDEREREQERAQASEREEALSRELVAAQAAVAAGARALEVERTALEAESSAHEQARAALRQAEADVDRLRAELAGMRASTSWRLTAPVRDLSRMRKLVRPGGVA